MSLTLNNIENRNKKRRLLSPQVVSKKRRRRLIFRIVLLVVFVVTFIFTTSWIARLPSLQLNWVVVEGISNGKEQEISDSTSKIFAEKYLYIYPKSNKFLFPKKAVSKELLKQYPRIKSVSLVASGQSLRIVAKEKNPEAIWCSGGNSDCYYVDADANIYASYDNSPNKFLHFQSDLLPSDDILVSSSTTVTKTAASVATTTSVEIPSATVLSTTSDLNNSRIGRYILDQKVFKELADISQKITTYGQEVEEVITNKGDSFQFKIKNNGLIIFSKEMAFEDSLNNLFTVLSNSAFSNNAKYSYIDIRFGKKIFYKMYNTSTTTTATSSTSTPSIDH